MIPRHWHTKDNPKKTERTKKFTNYSNKLTCYNHFKIKNNLSYPKAYRPL